MKKQNLFSFKLILHVFWIIPLLFIINSCKDKKDPEPDNKPPGKFTVSVIPSDTSAILTWTEAVDPDGDAIKYAVVLGDTQKATSLETTDYTINSLELATSYNGKIVASDGKGGFSEAAFLFETNKKVNSAPEDFTVSSVVNANESTISWTESNDPDGDTVKYDLELEGAIIKTDLTSLTHKLTDLEYSTSYTGKVIAKDGKGGTKEKAYNFKTGSQSNSAPGDFTVSTTVNGNGATITWTASTDPDGDAVKYDVELESSNVKTGLTGLSHSLSDLEYSKTFSGKIIAKDGKGGSKEKAYSFTTGSKPNTAPGDFTVSTAVNGNGATITWTASTDPDGDAVKYDVELGGSSVKTGLTGLSHSLSDLEYSKAYSGKIIAKDGNGGSKEKAYSFTTGSKPNTAPGDFTVSTAVNGNGATITWTASTDPDGDAIKYDVELGGSSVKTGLTGLSHSLSDLEYSKAYSGKVIAKDGKGGSKEKAYSFTTGSKPNSPPGAFTAKLDNLKSNTADISWTTATDPDGDAVTYSIELNGTVEQSGLTGNSTAINDLLYSTNYNITVKASDGNGGESSDSFSFNTLAAPPELPVTLFSNAANLNETHIENQINNFEFGLEFEPTVDGTITALGAKLCFGDYVITLWNAATMTDVMKVAVSINNADQSCNFLHMVDITPIAVQKGVKYMVTVNANNWYNYESTTSGANILPVTKGNVKFTRYGFKSGAKGFPTAFSLTRFAGIAEFKFVPDH